jgi:PAS domain S-box-containing protein
MHDESSSATIAQGFSLPALCRYFSEYSPLPMLAVEGETRIVRYVNPAFSQLVGKEGWDLVGVPLAEAVPEGSRNGCLALVDRVFHTGTPENVAEQVHRSDRPAYWSYIMWPILGMEGHPVGVMIQVTDDTEIAVFRKLVAEMNGALIVSSVREHEYRESTDQLNGRLKVALAHKDHFMAVLSHELRTPLAPILAAVAMLRQDQRLDADVQGLLEMVDRNVTTEARLIDDLLDMTRIERGEIHLDRLPIELGAIIDHAVEVCRPTAIAGNILLGVDRPDEPLIVDADASRLQQVFWNLLRNAIKFSPEGSRVQVRCHRLNDRRVAVEIRDSGVGIDPELLPRVFNAFQQGDKDQVRKFGGLGLGLAISKTIVDLHEGTIVASSAGEGHGATFSVELPLLVGVRPIPDVNDPGRSEPRFPLPSLRVLLVEDHEDTARIIRRILASNGHDIQHTSTVSTALKLAAEQPFDLLLSDLSLPDGSGYDLMRGLRAQGATFPGIVLSGFGQEVDIARSSAAGFDVHLTKPVGLSLLLSTIAKVIRNQKGR